MSYPRSTVNNWIVRNSIPASQQGIILYHSNINNIGLNAEDFIELPKILNNRKSIYKKSTQPSN